MSAAMSDQQSTDNMTEFFSPGPGERLRAARLSMGYDLAKIASELHLTTPVVELLEADDYDDIGARVFVRGYLRNYARIVGMPIESILRQFDEKWPDDGAGHATRVREAPRLPADGGPSRGLAGAMTWLVLVGLLALFLMWWRGYLDEIVPDPIRSGNPVENQQVDEALLPLDAGLDAGLPLDLTTGDGGLRLPARSEEEPPLLPAADGGVALPAQVPPPPAPRETLPPPLERPAMAPPTVPVPAAVETPVSRTEVTPPPDVAPVEVLPVSPAAPPLEQVVISFTDTCWVDVRDSERSFKLFGEMPGGSRRVLGGTPPYKMIIGNAGAVEILVNGEPFDVQRYTKGNVARFTLDPR